jgi:hypothetical protein
MTEADSLDIQLLVPDSASPGARVPVAMTIRNTTAKPIDLYLHGRGPTLDVIVRATDGRLVWQKLTGENLRAILKIHPLRAGETLTVGGEWPAAEPGEFTVIGVVLSESPRLESRPRRLVVR